MLWRVLLLCALLRLWRMVVPPFARASAAILSLPPHPLPSSPLSLILSQLSLGLSLVLLSSRCLRHALSLLPVVLFVPSFLGVELK
jgi:hypothetical protein